MGSEWFVLIGVLIGSASTIVVNIINNRAINKREKSLNAKEYYKEEFSENKKMLLDFLFMMSALRREIFDAHEKRARNLEYSFTAINDHILELSKKVDELDLLISDKKLTSLSRNNYISLVNLADNFNNNEINKETRLNNEFKLYSRNHLKEIKRLSLI